MSCNEATSGWLMSSSSSDFLEFSSIRFHPTLASLLITDYSGVLEVTVNGYIPDSSSSTDVAQALSTYVAASVGFVVSSAVGTSVTASATSSTVGGAVATVQAGSTLTLSASAITLIVSVQFFALTSGVSGNLSSTYRSLSCNLNYFNFQVPILGVGKGIKCTSTPDTAVIGFTFPPPPSSSPPPPAAGRRELLLASSPPSPPTVASQVLAAITGGSKTTQSTQDQIKSEQERMLMVGIVLSGLIVFHYLILWFWKWKWPLGQAPLPAFLVFPNPELILMAFTMQPMAQSLGVLFSIATPTSLLYGIIPLCYVSFILSFLAVLVIDLATRCRVLLPDHKEDEKKDILVQCYKYLTGQSKSIIRQASATGKKAKRELEPDRTLFYLNSGMSLGPLIALVRSVAPRLANSRSIEIGSSRAEEAQGDEKEQGEKKEMVIDATKKPDLRTPTAWGSSNKIQPEPELEIDVEKGGKKEEEEEEVSRKMIDPYANRGLVKSQITDRLGPAFNDYRNVSALTATFYLANMIANMVSGVITGVQQGANVPDGSGQSIGLNLGLLATQALLASYMTWIRPHASITAIIVAVIIAWLQTGTCACIVIIQVCTSEGTCNTNANKAMLYFQIAIVVMQILSVIFLILGMLTMTKKVIDEKRAEEARMKEELPPEEDLHQVLAFEEEDEDEEDQAHRQHLSSKLMSAIARSIVVREPELVPEPPSPIPAEEIPTVDLRSHSIKPPPPKPWVEGSLFQRRAKENDNRSVLDQQQTRIDQLLVDWKRLDDKERYQNLLLARDAGRSLDIVLSDMRDVALANRDVLTRMFAYYATMKAAAGPMVTSSVLRMSLNAWLAFFQEFATLDKKVVGVTRTSDTLKRKPSDAKANSMGDFAMTRGELHNIFISTKDKGAQVQDEKASSSTATIDVAETGSSMMRFEFFEGLVRVCLSWSSSQPSLASPSSAFEAFIKTVVVPRLPAEALVDPNEWREVSLVRLLNPLDWIS